MRRINNSIWAKLVPIILTQFAGCNSSISDDGPNPELTNKFIIAVVAEGIGEMGPRQTRVFEMNTEQARAMWEGVQAALLENALLCSLGSRIELRAFDDAGDPARAVAVAKTIISNPRILAVIGHGSSETTRQAAPYYATAGIPLLMPIATSPTAMYPPGAELTESARLQNCVRLPPSDLLVQIPAIAIAVRRHLSARRCVLICDVTRGAAEYSACFRKSLPSYIGDLIVATQDFDREKDNPSAPVTMIRSLRPDTVIFCGYGTTASVLMNQIAKEYGDASLTPPRLLLSDGCMTLSIRPSGLQTLVLFPAPDLLSTPDEPRTRPHLGVLKKCIERGTLQSYQLFGYDSIVLLDAAMARAGGRVSRSTLLAALQSLDEFHGAYARYCLKNGENHCAPYYIYSATSTNSLTTDGEESTVFSQTIKINAEDLLPLVAE